MAELILRCRRLINDVGGAVFSDQEVQDAFDEHRTDAWYQITQAMGTRPPGGGFIQYLDYYSNDANWESDVVLVDGTYNILDPSSYTSEEIAGHWAFDVSVHWPIYLKGKFFDLYATAVQLLEEWAAKVMLKFDFSDMNVRLQRSQQQKAILALADTYRAKIRPRVATIERSDIADPSSPLEGAFFQSSTGDMWGTRGVVSNRR